MSLDVGVDRLSDECRVQIAKRIAERGVHLDAGIHALLHKKIDLLRVDLRDDGRPGASGDAMHGPEPLRLRLLLLAGSRVLHLDDGFKRAVVGRRVVAGK